MRNAMIVLTDRIGRPSQDEDQMFEPEPGSVVLCGGPHGTAWQRYRSDGLWHSTRRGGAKDWAVISRKRNLVLIYEAEVQAQPTEEEEQDV